MEIVDGAAQGFPSLEQGLLWLDLPIGLVGIRLWWNVMMWRDLWRYSEADCFRAEAGRLPGHHQTSRNRIGPQPVLQN